MTGWLSLNLIAHFHKKPAQSRLPYLRLINNLMSVGAGWPALNLIAHFHKKPAQSRLPYLRLIHNLMSVGAAPEPFNKVIKVNLMKLRGSEANLRSAFAGSSA